MKSKKTLLLSFLVLGGSLMSFTLSTKSTKYNLLTAKSSLEWTGNKVGGSHEGTVDLKSGSFTLEDGMINSGTFVIDMTTMIPTDTKGSDTKKLTKHLRSKDFFNVGKYPTATIKIKSAKSTGEKTYTVTADLTILDKTNEITFDAKNLGTSASLTIASARITIDRTKWGITYKSSMVGDAFIRDEFHVKVLVVGKKEA